MRKRKTAALAGLAAGVLAATGVGLPQAAVAAPEDPVQVVAQGLSNPFGLTTFRGGFAVGESGPGQVTYIDKNGQSHTVTDNATGVGGVTAGRVRVFSVTGEAAPDEGGEPPNVQRQGARKGSYPGSSVLRTNVNRGRTSVLADLMAYELKHNPDGQAQFDENGAPYDALSNPFAITKYWKGLLVADGGANAVLLVKARSGKVSTFFVPPTVTDGACAGAENNPGTTGCDSVPTGVVVKGRSVYVSTLGAETPGAGKIYKLNARNGAVQQVWSGLDAPTGVAVGPDGSIYFSQVFGDAGEGPPGVIVRIAPDGTQTQASVPMPVGLTFKGGVLHATAWALGDPGMGQIVRIDPSAFHAAAPH